MMMPTPPRASASRESTQAGVICPLGSERCSLVAERTVLFLDMSGPSSRSLEQRIGHKNASFFLNCTRKKGDVEIIRGKGQKVDVPGG